MFFKYALGETLTHRAFVTGQPAACPGEPKALPLLFVVSRELIESSSGVDITYHCRPLRTVENASPAAFSSRTVSFDEGELVRLSEVLT
jgi:hypothetical protein